MLKHFARSLPSALLPFCLAGSALAQPAAAPPAPGAAEPPSSTPAAPAPDIAAPAPGAVPAPSLAPTVEAPKAATPPPAPGAKGLAVEFTSLRLMREKGVISQAEYDSALKDLGESTGLRAADSLTLVLGKVSTTFYGFIEAGFILDSTQSFNDVAANTPVARPGTFAAEHGRMMFSIRDSRFGFRIQAPEMFRVRASATLETDFFGPSLPIGSGQPYFGTEQALFVNPALRVRHAYFKLETPVVDVLIGQYWDLLGWQSSYLPNTIEYPGLPGELFGRSPQIRVSKAFKGEAASLELAVAMMRPEQRDSATPEGDAGIRLTFNKWNGVQTLYATSKVVSPASVAVTGNLRRVALPEFTVAPAGVRQKVGGAVAVDAFLPIIPTPKGKMGHSLSLNGEFVYGSGIANRYTGLTGGVANPVLPNPDMANPAPTYTPDIDPGIAVYDKSGKLQLVQWTTFLVGAQYYLPGLEGRAWVSLNYARAQSSNAKSLSGVWETKEWYDVNLFADPLPFLRFGLEAGRFHDTYADGTNAFAYRGRFTGFMFF